MAGASEARGGCSARRCRLKTLRCGGSREGGPQLRPRLAHGLPGVLAVIRVIYVGRFQKDFISPVMPCCHGYTVLSLITQFLVTPAGTVMTAPWLWGDSANRDRLHSVPLCAASMSSQQRRKRPAASHFSGGPALPRSAECCERGGDLARFWPTDTW